MPGSADLPDDAEADGHPNEAPADHDDVDRCIRLREAVSLRRKTTKPGSTDPVGRFRPVWN
jgi:hypothetical protein